MYCSLKKALSELLSLDVEEGEHVFVFTLTCTCLRLCWRFAIWTPCSWSPPRLLTPT